MFNGEIMRTVVQMNRRTMLKTAALAIPAIGMASKLFANENQEYIKIHTLFCGPVISGRWIEVEPWRPWEGEPPRGVVGFARRGRAFLKKEYAGYHSKTIQFQVDEPVWGEVIFEERWWKSRYGLHHNCKYVECACHKLERPSPLYDYNNFEQNIIEYTNKTFHAPKIGWDKFAKIGYDKLWPINYQQCRLCNKVACVFFHIGDRKEKPSGFYCMKCQLIDLPEWKNG